MWFVENFQLNVLRFLFIALWKYLSSTSWRGFFFLFGGHFLDVASSKTTLSQCETSTPQISQNYLFLWQSLFTMLSVLLFNSKSVNVKWASVFEQKRQFRKYYCALTRNLSIILNIYGCYANCGRLDFR